MIFPLIIPHEYEHGFSVYCSLLCVVKGLWQPVKPAKVIQLLKNQEIRKKSSCWLAYLLDKVLTYCAGQSDLLSLFSKAAATILATFRSSCSCFFLFHLRLRYQLIQSTGNHKSLLVFLDAHILVNFYSVLVTFIAFHTWFFYLVYNEMERRFSMHKYHNKYYLYF